MQHEYLELAAHRSNMYSSTLETLKKFKLLNLVTTLLTFFPPWTPLRAFERKRENKTKEGAGGKSSRKPEGLETPVFLPTQQERDAQTQDQCSCSHQPPLPTWQTNDTQKPPNEGALFSCPFHTRISATH